MTLVRTNTEYQKTLGDAMLEHLLGLEHNKGRLAWLDRALSLAFNENDEANFQRQRNEVFYDIYQEKMRFYACARLFAEIWPNSVCPCLTGAFETFERDHFLPPYAQKTLEQQRDGAKKAVEKPKKNSDDLKRLLNCVGLAGLDQYVIQHISEFAHTPGIDYKYTPTSKTSYRALWTEGKWYRNFPGKTGKRKRYLNEKWSNYARPLFVA